MVVILMILHVPIPVQGEGLRDFRDGWLLPLSDRASILAPAESRYSDQTNNGLAQSDGKRWGWWVGAGQGRLFSLEDLPLASLDCGWLFRSGKWPLSLGFLWERLGEHLYLEDTKTLKLGVGNRARIGIRVRARSWFVEKEPVDAGLEVGLRGGLSFSMGESLAGKVDIWLHASEIPGWHGQGGRRTLADLSLHYPGTGLALRVDQKNDGVPVISLEILGRLIPRVGLGWRIDPDTGSMGGSVSARVAGLWLQTSHLVHPALGVTHRFYLGAGDPGASPW